MADKDFEEEMKMAEERRKKEKLLKELDFDDEKRLLIEMNDKLASINSKMNFFVVLAVLSIIASILLPLFFRRLIIRNSFFISKKRTTENL